MAELPEPIPVPWTMKSASSAVSTVTHLDDGRLHASIRHDVVHGVSPEMLVWWFRNMDGELAIEGRSYPRYRVWHPRDHVCHRYVKRTPEGAGPGAVFHIHEVLARNPAYRVDILTDVVRLNLAGFAHRPRMYGLVAMDYRFERVHGGTRYSNSLTVGRAGSAGNLAAVRRFNQLLCAWKFDEQKARAWVVHNIEEVGNFEFFLPALYARETGG